MELKLTWREVLDAYKALYLYSWIDDYIREIVKPSGYIYFAWNGRILKLGGDGCVDTGLTVDDLV